MAESSKVEGPDLEHDGIAADTLVTGEPAAGRVGDDPVVVVRTAEGALHAVGGKCTHYGASLANGLCVAGQIRCPWHHAAFDLATGEAIGAPALNAIPVYEPVEREGRIFVIGRVDQPRPKPTPPSSPDSIVIVGAGAAGATSAEALRRYGYSGPVTLIGDEAPVDRPNLSKDYLAGSAPEEWIPLRGPSFYDDIDVDLITGARVESIDRTGRAVVLDDGRRIEFGALLLATGAEPRHLSIPGAELPHVHYLRTLQDSRRIIDAIEGGSRVAVIGSGFIGLEVAASMRERDIDVVVIAPEAIPLASVLGEELGRFVHDVHVEHGVQFRLGRNAEEIRELAVLLDDGEEVAADVVVVGIGVVPRTDLAEAAGLAVDDGVVVDDRLRTDDPGIWAAGDVATYLGPGGEHVRVEHWVVAARQGQAAARNMLGNDRPFAEPPFFWSQHYDVPINVVGHLAGWDQHDVAGDPSARDVTVAYRRDGAICGIATIYRDVVSLRAERALEVDDQEALEAMVEQA